MRLSEPDEGRVTWDGVAIGDASRASLRSHLAVVLQDPYVLGATIREAVRLGRPEATDEEVERALSAAALDEVIANLPEGADTPLDEGGRSLSGGQRQRIALARALIRGPSVLVLDEVSAALDPETEARIVETIAGVPEGVTVISVTHRPQVARSADRIVVLEDGQIVEQGTHEELVAAGGAYATIYQHQTAITVDDGDLRLSPAHLRTFPVLSGVSEDMLESLARAFETCRFEPGEILMREGDPSTEIFIIHRGRVEVTCGTRVVAQRADGECLGEMGLMFGNPRSATIRALTPTSCLRLDGSDFDRFVAADGGLEKAMLAVVKARGLLHHAHSGHSQDGRH